MKEKINKIYHRHVSGSLMTDVLSNGDVRFMTLTPLAVPCMVIEISYKDIKRVSAKAMEARFIHDRQEDNE